MGRLGGEGGSRGWRKIDEGVHVDSRRRGDSLVFSRDAFGLHVRIRAAGSSSDSERSVRGCSRARGVPRSHWGGRTWNKRADVRGYVIWRT